MQTANTKAVVNRAIELRSHGVKWNTVANEIKKEGFVTANGKPYGASYLQTVVAKRFKSVKRKLKAQAKERAEPRHGDARFFSVLKAVIDGKLKAEEKELLIKFLR